jgi:TPR repeat protein
MKVLVTVFLTIALLFGLAACTDVETREQKFANTEKKAAGGNMQAQYTLGLMYEQGYGVTQDKSRAALCYRKAAEKGQVDAQYRLGCLYYRGEGVPRDVRQAAEWYAKAANQDYSPAQAALGNMY